MLPLWPGDCLTTSSNMLLKAMAKSVAMRLIFFSNSFGQNTITSALQFFQILQDQDTPTTPTKPESSCLSSDLQPCDAKLGILQLSSGTQHITGFRVGIFLRLKRCLQVPTLRVAAPAGPLRAQG